MLVVLDAIDVPTRCWLERKSFETDDLGRLRTGLKLDVLEAGRCYELDAEAMAFIGNTYGVRFADKSLPVEMVVSEDRTHYDEQASHTGRELLLMLAGKKPFAHFCKIDRPEEDGIVPEDLFEPYVQSGRFTKRDEVIEMTRLGPLRRIYYAAAGEEWRIEAYRMLWRLCEKHNSWGDGFEKMEGYLLGYETDIDPFFR